jgi:hypothetical protein
MALKFTKVGSKSDYKSDYKRPKVTYQEQLKQSDIEEKMSGYIQVDNIYEVPLNTHLRYYTIDENGNQHFRMGGFLKIRENGQPFVMLTNYKHDWSVQIAGTVFFRKATPKEQKEEIEKNYSEIIDKKDKEIEQLKDKIEQLQKALRKLIRERKKYLNLE